MTHHPQAWMVFSIMSQVLGALCEPQPDMGTDRGTGGLLGTGAWHRQGWHSWSCCCLHPAVLLGAKLLCPILSTCPSTSCSPSLSPLLFHSVHQRWCWQLLTSAWGIFHSSCKQPFLQNILARLSNCPNQINKPA